MRDLVDQLQVARSEGGGFLLPPRFLHRLSGSDAFRYLKGQITRDLRRLDEKQALPACILTTKGKLCATLLIHCEGKDLLVESDLRVTEALTARLERYIVADDVTVSVESTHPTVHLFGRAATLDPWVSAPGIRVARMGTEGTDLDADHPEIRSLRLLDPRVVESLRVERGIPAWGSELGEETLPPEAGLDRTHIDYDRGCYPGQEVISRIKSIGRVNRLLRLMKAPAGSNLQAGMTILAGEGRDVGSITSVAPLADGDSSFALAYLLRTAAEAMDPLFALDPLTGGRTPLSISPITGT